MVEEKIKLDLRKFNLDKIDFLKWFKTLAFLLLILLIFNIYQTFTLSSSLIKEIDKSIEEARPADVEILIIKPDKSCEGCFLIENKVEEFKKLNVKVVKEVTLKASEASDYISKYDLKKLPAFLIEGEIEKLDFGKSFTKVSNGLVFSDILPPFFSIKENRIVGKVSINIINPSNCDLCTGAQLVFENLIRAGIGIEEYKELNEVGAKNLIQKYKITKLPALIASSELSKYDGIKNAFKSVGSVENDGSYVLRNVDPPYKDLTTGQVKGLVNVRYLVDESCSSCYDVKTFGQILSRNLGIKIKNENNIDFKTTEGKKLIETYAIKKLPAIIISSDVKEYPGAFKVLEGVGSVENDGSYVFRNNEVLGNYKDLETGKVVELQKKQ